MPSLLNNLLRRLRLRAYKGDSLNAVAKRLDLAPQYLSKIETGKLQSVDPDILKHLVEKYAAPKDVAFLLNHLQSPAYKADEDGGVFFNDLSQFIWPNESGRFCIHFLPFRLRDDFFAPIPGAQYIIRPSAVANAALEGEAGIPRGEPLLEALTRRLGGPSPSCYLLPPEYKVQKSPFLMSMRPGSLPRLGGSPANATLVPGLMTVTESAFGFAVRAEESLVEWAEKEFDIMTKDAALPPRKAVELVTNILRGIASTPIDAAPK